MRDYPVRKEHHLKDYDYASPGYYFVTICANQRGVDLFSSVGAADPGGLLILLTPLGNLINDLICGIEHAYRDVSVDCYAIMPDHIHLLLALGCGGGPPGSAVPTALPKVINALKGFVTRQWGNPVWQDDYYDHIIRNDADLRETREYIQSNPARWRERGVHP